MTKNLSLEEKAEIRAFLEMGKMQVDIAKKYQKSQSTIARLVKKIRETGCLNRKAGSGRKRSLNQYDLNYLEKIIKINPHLGSKKIAENMLKDRKKEVTESTIRRYLIGMGLKGRISCRKPLLSKKHIKARLEWAKKRYNWTKEDWKKVIWSDETKINLFGSDGRRYVRRRDGTRLLSKNLTPTVKHGGGSIMLWGCFNYKGIGELHIIKGTMDRYVYTKILNTSLKRSIDKFDLDRFIFQQDNDPKHTSAHTKNYCAENNIDVMDWPSQSPDLNPIENLWHIFKENVAKRLPKNLKHLEELCKEEWKNLDTKLIEKLVLSMKNRCREVLDAKGGHTSY